MEKYIELIWYIDEMNCCLILFSIRTFYKAVTRKLEHQYLNYEMYEFNSILRKEIYLNRIT